MRNVGDLVISRARLADTLSRVERRHPGRRVARHPGERDRHRSPAAHAARRHHARAPRAGRRDFPAHAVRRARSRARDRQARPPRAAGPEHRDRQVSDRADDGSGAAPGAQRRQPRHRDGRTSASPPASGPKARSCCRAATAGDIVRIDIADDGRGMDAEAVVARARDGRLAGARRPDRCARRCWRCSARRDSRRATSPIAPAAAASA